jgi:PAS domain S-box-containing protein
MQDYGLTTASAVNPAAVALAGPLQSWNGLVERLPIGVFSCDRDGLLVRCNQRAVELWGRTPAVGDPVARYCGAVRAFESDGALIEPFASPMDEALRSGRPVRDRELVAERADGDRIHILANIDPLFDDDGAVIGAVNCFQDISAVRRAETKEHEGEQRARALLDALPAAVYTTDAEGRITYFNEAAVELAGRRPVLGVDQWCVTWRLRCPDGTPLAHEDCPMADAVKNNRAIRGVEAIAERPDGSQIPFMPFPSPLRDESGALVGAINMLVDITERKKAEEQQKRLVDELNHRVKNTLASVQSIARHTARQSDSLDAFGPMFEARLMALSRVHDLLTGSCWAGARLFDVLAQSLAPYGAQDRTVISGDDIDLDPRTALALGMALHELADNAIRHGALSVDSGHLDIAAHRADGAAGLTLDWIETGGPLIQGPVTRGFGLRLVEAIVAADLDGAAQVSFPSEGVRCAIAFSLPPAAAIQ